VGAYRRDRIHFGFRPLKKIVQGSILGTLVFTYVCYFLGRVDYSRIYLVLFTGLVAVTLVVERGLLDQVLGQLKLGQSGVIDPGTAQQVGKIAGVEAVVLGTITDLDTTVAINCRLIAVETGQLLAAANTRILKDDDVRRILAEHGSDASAEPSGVKSERVGRTIYFGGDCCTQYSCVTTVLC